MYGIVDVVCERDECIWPLDFVGSDFFFYISRPRNLWSAEYNASSVATIKRMELKEIPACKIVATFRTDSNIDFVLAKSSDCNKYLYILRKNFHSINRLRSSKQKQNLYSLMRLEVDMPNRLVEFQIKGCYFLD